MKTQKGAAMVEFAMIALLFFALLFGIIEFGRAFFVYNTLVEATRRGARVAAVCPASADAITMVQQATIFDSAPGNPLTQTTGLLGLNTTDVSVTYWKSDIVTQVATPLAASSTNYDTIAFVRVQILSLNSNNNINLLIPGVSIAFPVPPIVTTLPSESLGRVSSQNPVTQRCCYGVCT
ncbi:MAG: TadE/TadG family type IV pilus assembly protein [Methylococcales bacterium]|nr:TadE/TadG family type IV pilus assembly protein [Methylococcales bacterium]MDD5630669.1 TadE/TadG family type IV pilus assembly protein [Methylococcales bacterium]